ncbi:MAG: XRE family transcriptional regulator [Abitibacteriaceae bacterium]|nr:XRE family transcriptional regulator [Abditibacteriaceae bacterium]
MKLNKKTTRAGTVIETGSGNVFADLDLPDAPNLQFKSQLIYEITRCIEDRQLSQTEAAKLIGMDQPTLSKMLRGQFLNCSTDRLFSILNRLGRDIEVRVFKREADPEDARVVLVA